VRRIVLWVLSTASVLVLLFGFSTSTAGPLATSTDTTVRSAPAASSTGGSTGTTRTVTGSVADTRWGPVQVRLAVASGKITKVSVVQYPSDNPKDDEINSYALPILTRETVDAQSADIDMVSGATVTSDGYVRSLQSALDQAGL
jgi:uncharacterized protein with FMN-binding domain